MTRNSSISFSKRGPVFGVLDVGVAVVAFLDAYEAIIALPATLGSILLLALNYQWGDSGAGIPERQARP